MGTKKQDRARIEKAATDVANKDYSHFRAAVQYATEYTELGLHAFGMASSTALLPRYVAARNSQVQNLEDGLQKFEEAIRGMLEVAYRMSATEAASTIDFANPAQVWQTKVRKPSGPHDEGFRSNAPLLRIAGTGAQLAPTWMASTLLKCSFSRFMIVPALTTLASLSMWFGVKPDDDEINDVLAGWLAVSDELQQVGLYLMASDVKSGSLPRSVWDDDARDAFDKWVTNFQNEVAQASREAVDASYALAATLEDIHEIQSIMSSLDAATAFALSTLFVVGMYPVLTVQARLAQQVIAHSNAVATAFSVGTIIGQAVNYGSAMTNVSGAGKFHKLTINNDPSQKYGTDNVNDTFIDLDIDWL